jgi:transcriptional regulator with XRE-family HTH domain
VWTLGDRLRKARQHANVSTEEMAADVGRTVHTISNYERDFTRAPLLVIRQYALRTGVPLTWLEYGTTSTPPTAPLSEC